MSRAPTTCTRTPCVEAREAPIVWADPDRDPCNLECAWPADPGEVDPLLWPGDQA